MAERVVGVWYHIPVTVRVLVVLGASGSAGWTAHGLFAGVAGLSARVERMETEMNQVEARVRAINIRLRYHQCRASRNDAGHPPESCAVVLEELSDGVR